MLGLERPDPLFNEGDDSNPPRFVLDMYDLVQRLDFRTNGCCRS
jgi:hypothetical protein